MAGGRRLLAALPVLAAVVALSACSITGLDFRADDRLTITTPPDRSAVTVPFDVDWTLSERQPAEQQFAVLVDASPPRPGAPITDLLPPSQQNTSACDAACQSAALAARGVYVTSATSQEIPVLPRPTGVSADRARRHTITVVVLDDHGRRVGEVADSVDVDEEYR